MGVYQFNTLKKSFPLLSDAKQLDGLFKTVKRFLGRDKNKTGHRGSVLHRSVGTMEYTTALNLANQ